MKARLIEQGVQKGLYGFDQQEVIVEIGGQRIYLCEGYGGEGAIMGGGYRWIHGIAILIDKNDTLNSLHNDTEAYSLMVGGYDNHRPIQDWDGEAIDTCARGAIARAAAATLGSLGGSVKSKAKSEAARENGKKGGRPRKAPQMSIAVTKDGKPRTLELVSGGGVQYECVIRYPDGQTVRARIQPEADGSVPDLHVLAELNGFEVTRK